ncbi:MAG: M48 family metallopeptidase [Chitinophagales bacterium]|nr:M48 family metallopeptidase [Chitinophagales bacterium]
MLLYIIIIFIILEFLFGKYLDFINEKNWSLPIPDSLKDIYDEASYQKSKDYHQANKQLSNFSGWLTFIITIAFIACGGFGILDRFVRSFTEHYILQGLAFFGIIGIVSEIISLPFSYYGTFVIEEKFGFNKMNLQTFITDKIKGLLLSIIIGGGILSALMWLHSTLGSNFWLYAWLLMTVITVFFATFYTSIFVPMFNKLTPLENGSLREKIETFATQVGFPLTNVFVIDGSKRSTKANAYFSGFGPKKTIVLFDTLLKEQTEEELVAILAHEIGHYKKKHVLWTMLISIIHMGILLFVAGLFINNLALANALGATEPSFYIGIIAFSFLYSPISTVLGIAMNIFSRKNEFEADRYAKDNYSALPLVSALKKLSKNNLSNLNPHPKYVFVHYSHPPLKERIETLLK